MASTLFKVSFAGTLNGTKPEIFAHSQWFGTVGGAVPGSAVLTALGGYVTAFLAHAVVGVSGIPIMGAAFPNWVHWTSLKVAEWDAGTNTQTGPSVVAPLVDDGEAGPAHGLPYQDAFAVTLRSGSVGRRIYNRFYLPPFVIEATDGSGLAQQGIIDSIGSFLNTEQSLLEAGGVVKMIHYSPTGRVTATVVDAFLGRVIDTQRRRRNAETEEPRTVVSMP